MQLIETAFQMEAAQKKIQAADRLAVDIETFDHETMEDMGQVRLIQVGTPDDIFVFDLFETGFPAFLKPVFQDESIVKILHYGVFDMSHLIHHYQVKFENTFCTYLASRVLSTGLSVRNGLKDVVKRYLDKELDKEEQASDWSGILTPSQLAYAANDVDVLFPLHDHLSGILESKGLHHVARLEFGLQRIEAIGRASGIALDPDRRSSMQAEIRSAFPANMDLDELAAASGTKLPSPVMQQMLTRYRLLKELDRKPARTQLITRWRDFAQFYQKDLEPEILEMVPHPYQRIDFRGLWLPALSACAKDYRTREHIEDSSFLRTPEAAMLRALAEKDHKAMEQHKYKIHEFARLYPGMRQWQERAGSLAVGRKPVRLPSGRIIHTRMFEPHRPDYFRQILQTCIADFFKTLILLAHRENGSVFQFNRDNQSIFGHLDNPEKWPDRIRDAARFAFGRELPDHFYKINMVD